MRLKIGLLPPGPPSCGLPGHWGPWRYDRSCDLEFEDQLLSALLPVAEQPVEPLRGQEGIPFRGK